MRNIREANDVEVYDRPAIILEIFHRHARTKEAQLQVELARLKYLAPRERVSGDRERRGGGRGARGVSESFHEIERRKVRDRTSELQRELKAVHREQVERRRHREGLPKVAIVGYTNAVHVKAGTKVQLKITAIDHDHGFKIATVRDGALPNGTAGSTQPTFEQSQ